MSQLSIINSKIKQLECLVTADAGESPLLKQLRTLRDDIKTKADVDYVEVQSNVLNTWRTLMEQLTSLAFFAKEADKDVRPIEKAVSQLNKLKSSIVGELIKDDSKEDEKEEKVTSNAKDDIQNLVTKNGGIYFNNYEKWVNNCKELKYSTSRTGNVVSAKDADEKRTGEFLLDDGCGYVFTSNKDYSNVFGTDLV